MKNLFDSLVLNTTTITNRICVPPMVCFNWSNEDGIVDDLHIQHYKELAEGGVGLIIQEATCIAKNGRLHASQLGIWNDNHIEGLRKITDAVRPYYTPIVMQIHHAGMVSVTDEPMGPSAYDLPWRKSVIHARELSTEQVEEIIQQFIDAAIRAEKAGYNGVELHGCHNYLLCQFLNSNVNTRSDIYHDGMKMVEAIITGIRTKTSPDFIVGIRLGGFEPTLSAAIEHAQRLDELHIDYINVSYGFSNEEIIENCPEDMLDIHYAASCIKKAVSCSVFLVNSIDDKQKAEAVLQKSDVDMIAIGRAQLVNPNFANDAKANRNTGKCLHCSPCQWLSNPQNCQGRKLYLKSITQE